LEVDAFFAKLKIGGSSMFRISGSSLSTKKNV
jgi:hypothetical protein